MKCLHCRQGIFTWNRRCPHCGAAAPKTVLHSSTDASATAPPDLTTIRAVMPLRTCDCFEDGTETRSHSEIQDTQSEGWRRPLELVEIAAADGREEFTPLSEMTLTITLRNFKYRPLFPRLQRPLSSTAGVDLSNLRRERYGAPEITTCSICRAPLAQVGLHQVWISLNVGTDVLPLLVNACSVNCVTRFPPAASGYVCGPLGPPTVRS